MKRPAVTLSASAESPSLMLEALLDARILLKEVLAKLESGADFQLGPQGRDRDLPVRIRAALNLRIS